MKKATIRNPYFSTKGYEPMQSFLNNQREYEKLTNLNDHITQLIDDGTLSGFGDWNDTLEQKMEYLRKQNQKLLIEIRKIKL